MRECESNLREGIQVLSNDVSDSNDIAAAISKIRTELSTSKERAARALQVCASAAALVVFDPFFSVSQRINAKCDSF